MTKRLEGAVVLITGAALGQGNAHARRMAAEGAHLVLGDIRVDDLETLASELRSDGTRVLAGRLDVADPDDWSSLVQDATAEFGTITGLVNNAGIMSRGSVLDETLEDWMRTLAVNQTGVFLGLQSVAPIMQKAGRGSIVNVASTLGRYASTVGFAYQATKGAMLMMSKSAALSLGPSGVRVNTILPGLVDTPFLADSKERGALADPVSRTPLGRIGKAEELASVAAFLISDDAAYMSGAELVVDGGMTSGSLQSLKPLKEI
ncbi:SDR family NAD(P)-dependent oxidoreductase [Gephyromycinifex aptenodytis]|uniref:SDR family NAD(P)-dependent oxidoreductase n=1 Tax=Gephyromycinifex aptenodytis TaxID=2716227 RepID=UPI0014488132|nr:SDR family NAD(P)-dependent oxidoreductase [Gephyromycinifex aptenodytis]